MRLLVPIVSLIVAASPVIAQSKPTPTTKSANPKTFSTTVVQLYNGFIQADADTAKEIIASPRLRAEVEKAMATAKAGEHACFTMEIHAPKRTKPASSAGLLEKPYTPPPITLQSTCSPRPAFRPVPLSATVPQK